MMKSDVMDSSLAAVLLLFAYALPTWLWVHNWSNLAERLDRARASSRNALVALQTPLCNLFLDENANKYPETEILRCVRNYFSGEATVLITPRLHLALTLPLLIWAAIVLVKSDLWSKGQIPIADFATIFVIFCVWSFTSVAVLGLQYWGFLQLANAKPSFGAKR